MFFLTALVCRMLPGSMLHNTFAGVHSVLSNSNLPDKVTPRQYRTGVTPDISPWLQFTFWQPILFLENENSWPSSKERRLLVGSC